MLQRIKQARETESGFTLIELLIVIVVLGILAGIVVFGVGTFRADSRARRLQGQTLKTRPASQPTPTTPRPARYAGHRRAALTAGGYLQSAAGVRQGRVTFDSGHRQGHAPAVAAPARPSRSQDAAAP